MQKKCLTFSIVFVLLTIVSNYTKAQHLEFGLMLGATNYKGELTGKQFVDFSQTKPAIGLVARYNYNRNFTIKGSVFYGGISGADSLSQDEDQFNRNLSFQSGLFEFSAQFEYNIMKSRYSSRRTNRPTPFIFAGVAIYKYNPLGNYGGQLYELQPLATEGQGTTSFNERRKYALTQISVPFGVGVKFDLSPRLNLTIEGGPRLTFNDYLDDISTTYVDTTLLTAAYGEYSGIFSDRSGEKNDGVNLGIPGTNRGNPDNRDWYGFVGITITYKILAQVKCPKM